MYFMVWLANGRSGGALGDSKHRFTAVHPSIAKKHDLREPSPLEKVLRNEADEVS